MILFQLYEKWVNLVQPNYILIKKDGKEIVPMALSRHPSDTNIITFPKLVLPPMASISSNDSITQLRPRLEPWPDVPSADTQSKP